MFGRIFARVYAAAERHRWMVVAAVGFATAASALYMRSVPFDNNVEIMLPRNDEMLRALHFLEESKLTAKVAVSLESKHPERSADELIDATDRLADSLRPPLVTEVIRGAGGADPVGEVLIFLKYTPQLTSADDLTAIQSRLTRNGADTALRGVYRQMLSPGSGFAMPFVRSDPLGIDTRFLALLQKLPSYVGYDVRLEKGHFISSDGRHSLLVLSTPVAITDGFGARRLDTYLRSVMKSLPDTVSASIVSGHQHTISNEAVIRRDMKVPLGITAIAFFLLFLFVFRDHRALLVYLVPFVGFQLALGLSVLFLHRLSSLMVAMGSVIVGITVDYAIYVYVAIRNGENRAQSVRHVALPVLAGGLTTIAAFAVFFVSTTPGFRQLAVLSTLSVGICLVCSLFVIPHFFVSRSSMAPASGAGEIRVPRRYRDLAVVLIAAAVGGTVLWKASGLRLETDIQRLDGSDLSVVDTEKEFNRVWGSDMRKSILVAPGRTLEDALRLNEDIYREASHTLGDSNVASLAPLWPSFATRSRNAERWQSFWTEERRANVRRLLAEAGARYNFSESAFTPFLDRLQHIVVPASFPPDSALLQELRARFIMEKPGHCEAITIVPDEARFQSGIRDCIAKCPGTYVVSPSSLGRYMAESASREVVVLFVLSTILVFIVTLVLLRDLKLTALAHLAAAAGVIGMIAVHLLLDRSITSQALMAAMVVSGMTVDYGIFMVLYCKYRRRTGAQLAVTLSALSTVIGTSVLVLAHHPVLRAIGVTLTSGLLFGYAAAIVLVPAAYSLWLGRAEVDEPT